MSEKKHIVSKTTTIKKDGTIEIDYRVDGVSISSQHRAYIFLVQLEDELQEYPRLIHFLTEYSETQPGTIESLEKKYNLRRLIMESLRIGNREFSAFLFGLLVKEEGPFD